MAKEIKYQITLLRFLISTFLMLVFTACEIGYELKEKNPTTGGASGGGPIRAWRRLFTTTTAHNGNLGGIAGADAKCMSDASYPGSGTYKAFLVTATRTASPVSNWVLSATTEYRQLDDATIIGTTTAASIFTDPMTNSFTTVAGGFYAWTGIKPDWTNAVNNCTNWTAAAGMGMVAWPASNNYTYRNWSYDSNYSCANTYNLICVEQ